MKLLQQRDLSTEERLAARLRLAEKRVLQSTLDAVRRCASVIRTPNDGWRAMLNAYATRAKFTCTGTVLCRAVHNPPCLMSPKTSGALRSGCLVQSTQA